MFKIRPLRTLLTILGVSVGIGTVLFLVSLGYGLQNVILSKIATTDSLLTLDVISDESGLIKINKESIDRISKLQDIEDISSIISLPAQISMGEFTGDGAVKAVDPSYFRLGGINTDYGNNFRSDENYEAVISTANAMLFNMTPKEIIGQELALTIFLPKINEKGNEIIKSVKREQKYKIVGVIEDENMSYVYIPLGTIGDLNIDNYDQLKVKVTNNEAIKGVRNEIIKEGFLVASLSDTIDQANKIFKIIQIVLALFGLVALLVSAIGMFNTMTIALLEKINEIGIMRSIGVTRGDISKLFLFESIIMGFLGGVGGVIIGYLAGKISNTGLNILARNFGGQPLDIFYNPLWFIAVIMVFSTLIGLLTGVYPSIKAARLNPLEALRYK